jgi:ectoine hydroxylase-related dioxygenase (phytanoyl-CoA dioxygenase family)
MDRINLIAGWEEVAKEKLVQQGFVLVESGLSDSRLADIKERMYLVQKKIHKEIGLDRLTRAGEIGVLRNMFKYDAELLRLLELPVIRTVSEKFLSPTSVLHLQNGFILPPASPADKKVFQTCLHRDFPRYFNGALMSINILITVDEFNERNGGTLVIPGSHQNVVMPTEEDVEKNKLTVDCPPGTALIFDSTLWHAAGINLSQKDRIGINHQFTLSFIKQQIDYCRALEEEQILQLPERSQQMLGYYTRVVTSLDEYYQPTEKRFYRAGQG